MSGMTGGSLQSGSLVRYVRFSERLGTVFGLVAETKRRRWVIGSRILTRGMVGGPWRGEGERYFDSWPSRHATSPNTVPSPRPTAPRLPRVEIPFLRPILPTELYLFFEHAILVLSLRGVPTWQEPCGASPGRLHAGARAASRAAATMGVATLGAHDSDSAALVTRCGLTVATRRGYPE